MRSTLYTTDDTNVTIEKALESDMVNKKQDIEKLKEAEELAVSSEGSPNRYPFSYNCKSKAKFNIDSSGLSPSLKTRLKGKDFDKAYLAELEFLLYHPGSEVKMEEMTEIMYIHTSIVRGERIRVVSASMVRMLPRITSVLNLFFYKNFKVIDAISVMVGNSIAGQNNTEAVTDVN